MSAGAAGASRPWFPPITACSVERAPTGPRADTGVLVVDAAVHPAHSRRLARLMRTAVRRAAPPIVVEDAESEKTPEGAARLWRAFSERGLDRGSLVVGVGGGALLDLAGFAAAVYWRGLPFWAVPTTLLAQADAAVGGKTGVNFDGAKNQLGVIRQPRRILLDGGFLRTLSPEAYDSGLGEIAKTALLAGGAAADAILRLAPRLRRRDPAAGAAAALRCARFKARLVARDPEERAGVRILLNAGHTAGHVFEAAAAARRLPCPHGAAVAAGLAAEAAFTAAPGREAVERTLAVFGLSAVPPVRPSFGEALRLLRADKKRSGDRITLPVVHARGRVKLVSVDPRALARALAAPEKFSDRGSTVSSTLKTRGRRPKKRM